MIKSSCKFFVNTILNPIACFCFSFPPRLCHNLYMPTETRDIQKHVLPNGLVVITEPMSHVRSVSVGVWVRNGSRREVPEENGLAHFMEHMVFKGTDRPRNGFRRRHARRFHFQGTNLFQCQDS
jgi:predicted Zn-dependent peptidase